MLPLNQPKHDREQLFISRYTTLREWALKLTDRNEGEAEDLLHDTFIHFTLSKTRIDEIQNLDGYLYTMLRNLRLSQARRLARTPLGNLTLIDYDSAEDGLNSVDPRDRIKGQDELRAICHYACLRKQTSKCGGVLILRFFHGYYPNEIAQILKSPRSAVDNLLQTARREARLFKTDPDALAFFNAGKSPSLPQFAFGQVSTDVLTEVREAIFMDSEQSCPKPELADIYRGDGDGNGDASKPIDAALLAHLVSCSLCLEKVNELLELPSIASRLSADEDKRDTGGTPPKSGGGSGGGSGTTSAETFLMRSRKRVKQVLEHQPEELHISVNGFIIGSQRINSELSELGLSVNLDEKIGFIEVFSERDVRLLFQSVETPPEGLAVQSAHMDLSGGRKLELELNFSGSLPHLFASYHDPSFAEARSHSESSSAVRSAGKMENSSNAGERLSNTSAGTGIKGFLARLLKWFTNLDFRLWLQPVRITAILSVLIISALVLWKLNIPTEPVSVTDLLTRAETNERQMTAAKDIVVHRVIVLEERDASSNIVDHRKLEIWNSGEQGLAVRRMFDAYGKLIAGEWKRGDGTRTLYNAGEKPRIGKAEPTTSAPVTLDEAWLMDTTVENFRRLTAGKAAGIMAETDRTYTVAYQPGANENSNNPRLTSAKIVLSKDDLRVMEQILTVQRGEDLREYRYVEASYQQLSPRTVNPAVFEPERELLGSSLKDLKIKGPDSEASPEVSKQDEAQVTNAPDAANANTAANQPATPVTATAELEVEALNLLNKAGADTGEQVTVARDSRGILKVEGIVESENRKNELIRALAPISNNPAVRINILTVAEAVAREQKAKQSPKGKPGQESTERIDTSGGEVPVRQQLTAYFGSEEAANNFASKMIGRSRNAMSRAGALKRLVGQFTLAELKSLSPEAREKWVALIRSHARAFQQETAALRQDLTPVFGGGAGGAAAPAIEDDASLIRAVTRLFELGATNDRTIRSALSISSDRAGTGLSSDFFRSLRTTEDIANRLQTVR